MIVAIIGPTGVGKTKLSIELAKRLQAIIINCDAVQIYKELNIGSAKVSIEEQEGIKHYLINEISPNEDFTVYDYQKIARKIIQENSNKNIILVGGTGLYLKATLYDYQFFKEPNNHEKYENLTTEEIYNLAILKDPNCPVHPHNRQRLIRFLNKQVNPSKAHPLYNATFIGLTTDRSNLYNIINKRVDKMITDGLVLEVKELMAKYPHAPILNNAIGYKEIKLYLENKLSLEEAIELIKKNSRHYAKRQYTFFNNQLPVNWFNVDYENFTNTIEEVVSFLKKNSK